MKWNNEFKGNFRKDNFHYILFFSYVCDNYMLPNEIEKVPLLMILNVESQIIFIRANVHRIYTNKYMIKKTFYNDVHFYCYDRTTSCISVAPDMKVNQRLVFRDICGIWFTIHFPTTLLLYHTEYEYLTWGEIIWGDSFTLQQECQNQCDISLKLLGCQFIPTLTHFIVKKDRLNFNEIAPKRPNTNKICFFITALTRERNYL